MTNEELKQALLDEQPVYLMQTDGTEIEYGCVYSIVYRKINGKIAVSATVLDKNKFAVLHCDPKRLRRKEVPRSD